MNNFKQKRPHSPDSLTIRNYKRQRLLLDFQSLSITNGTNDQHQRNVNKYPATKDSKVINLNLSNELNLTIPTKFMNTLDKSTDNKVIYENWKSYLYKKNLQLIQWVDMKLVIYTIWFNWFSNLNDHTNLNINADMDMDDEYYNGEIDEDGDIDMDME
ncbi:hypothetical protein TBLA_0H03580 [Henningerozyma blattae CBS 6284]|uniref:Uncharacterized protein n=1 Tax=Henningerozyma blattae (strain ATCC 34711 / CBS 6284 / DSM 70876 / NBRC 10599 / NRRL Y-10934 / UCD 77-7) TaxID=1071380 RepID=I2H8D8_HENB6|nr:hypothetical protein TBLA_0H03580 [Tetrapisispora blattae CBS 6284]CCH62640.1 hypothetical protein TBLA_0H03580 [Tetrapisispora blattae CBS 6284]